MKCKVAFVGAGYMTSEHLKAFNDISGVELSGIYSRTRSRAESLAKQFSVSHVCNSIAELYQITKADLIVVSVPELSTRSVMDEVFKFPWLSLIEKPAGYDIEDAENILKESKKYSSKAYVALNRRHYGSTQNVLSALKETKGTRLIQINDQEDVKAALAAGQPELVAQNWMYANSIHLIDYFQLFARGSLVSVENIIPWNPNSPFLVMSKLIYDSGDIGIYQAVWNAPGPWSVVVSTQERRFEMRPIESAFEQVYGKRILEPMPSTEWDSLYKPGLRRQAEFAVKAALNQGDDIVSSLPTLEQALNTMKITRKIYFDE
jgi:predicted dehydrogenase